MTGAPSGRHRRDESRRYRAMARMGADDVVESHEDEEADSVGDVVDLAQPGERAASADARLGGLPAAARALGPHQTGCDRVDPDAGTGTA